MGCCSDSCKRRLECSKYCINIDGECFVEDYANFGSGTFTDNGCEVEYWCGELGDYKMFEQIVHKWIKLYEQAPPIAEDVEVLFVENGEEKVHVNRLIPMVNGRYIWSYCDYDDCDEVLAWRKIAKYR